MNPTPRRLLFAGAVATVTIAAALAMPSAASATGVGGISGKVTEVGGSALGGVTVNIISPISGTVVASRTTAFNGTYSDYSLDPGKYWVCFDPGTGTHAGHSLWGYTYQCWLNKN